MTDWREFAAKGQWDKIDGWKIRSLGGKDLVELRETLRAVVPMVERGHGVETYKDYATAEELNDARWKAAHLLEIVNTPGIGEGGPYGNLCGDEVNLAVSVLAQVGIEYEGMGETYVYATQDGWVQLRPDIGAALCQRRFELVDRAEGDTEEFIRLHQTWHARYPWRRVLPLRNAWSAGLFAPNSPEDHALFLLDSYEKLSESFHEFLGGVGKYSGGAIGNRGSRALDLIFLARNAIAIGTHAEALRKKPFEPLALARIKQKRAFAHRNEGRDMANAQRRLRAREWQAIAREISKESMLEGTALARWVSTQLDRRYSISKAPKTVAAALRSR